MRMGSLYEHLRQVSAPFLFLLSHMYDILQKKGYTAGYVRTWVQSKYTYRLKKVLPVRNNAKLEKELNYDTEDEHFFYFLWNCIVCDVEGISCASFSFAFRFLWKTDETL